MRQIKNTEGYSFGIYRKIKVQLIFLVVSVASLLVLAFYWANFAELDQRARGTGTVIPEERVQITQNLEGGILSELFVKVGVRVVPQQTIAVLQNKAAEIELKQTMQSVNFLQTKIIRLISEIENQPPQFPDELKICCIEEIRAQLDVEKQNKANIENVISTLNSQRKQRSSEFSEAKSKIQNLEKSLELLSKQIKITLPAVKRGVFPEVKFLDLRISYSQAQGELDAVKKAIPRLKESIQELEIKAREVRSTYQKSLANERSETQNELKLAQSKIIELQDRVGRTEIKSPVDGIVKDIKYTSIGSVVLPGDVIVEIVPSDEKLLIETKIDPKDIAFISEGQTASVTISAFDPSIFGILSGEVQTISADTSLDDDNRPFYKVLVSTKLSDRFIDKGLQITPGMIAEVDILTGKNTLLNYLLKPITKVARVALTER